MLLDFGISFHTLRPVAGEIGNRLINTLVLILPSMIVAYAIGAFVGAMVAWKRGSKLEGALVLIATALQSTPVFWLGMLAILFFSIRLDLFPVGHIVSPGMFPEANLQMYLSLDFLHHLALPFMVNVAYQFCFPFLLMRSTMLSTIGEDYIELARMKGVPEKRILYHHAMRNSMLPLATTLPMILGWAVAGSVVIETVFSWPGLGLLMVEAARSLGLSSRSSRVPPHCGPHCRRHPFCGCPLRHPRSPNYLPIGAQHVEITFKVLRHHLAIAFRTDQPCHLRHLRRHCRCLVPCWLHMAQQNAFMMMLANLYAFHRQRLIIGSAQHFWGRDVMSQMLWGARPALIIGVLTALGTVIIGVNIGLLAGYLGGHVDNFLMRLTDIFLGLPFLPFIIVLLSLTGPKHLDHHFCDDDRHVALHRPDCSR